MKANQKKVYFLLFDEWNGWLNWLFIAAAVNLFKIAFAWLVIGFHANKPNQSTPFIHPSLFNLIYSLINSSSFFIHKPNQRSWNGNQWNWLKWNGPAERGVPPITNNKNNKRSQPTIQSNAGGPRAAFDGFGWFSKREERRRRKNI